MYLIHPGFPGSSDHKESACNAGALASISGSGRSPGEGNGYSLQYSCLENPMDRGAWQVQSIAPQSIGHDLVTEHVYTGFWTLLWTMKVSPFLLMDSCSK